jgi:hypothetical protein
MRMRIDQPIYLELSTSAEAQQEKHCGLWAGIIRFHEPQMLDHDRNPCSSFLLHKLPID